MRLTSIGLMPSVRASLRRSNSSLKLARWFVFQESRILFWMALMSLTTKCCSWSINQRLVSLISNLWITSAALTLTSSQQVNSKSHGSSTPYTSSTGTWGTDHSISIKHHHKCLISSSHSRVLQTRAAVSTLSIVKSTKHTRLSKSAIYLRLVPIRALTIRASTALLRLNSASTLIRNYGHVVPTNYSVWLATVVVLMAECTGWGRWSLLSSCRSMCKPISLADSTWGNLLPRTLPQTSKRAAAVKKWLKHSSLNLTAELLLRLPILSHGALAVAERILNMVNS